MSLLLKPDQKGTLYMRTTHYEWLRRSREKVSNGWILWKSLVCFRGMRNNEILLKDMFILFKNEVCFRSKMRLTFTQIEMPLLVLILNINIYSTLYLDWSHILSREVTCYVAWLLQKTMLCQYLFNTLSRLVAKIYLDWSHI